MPNVNDLTTLERVKAWIMGNSSDSVIPANSDPILDVYITEMSRVVMGYLSRSSVLPKTTTEIRSGTGGYRILLREYPVISVSSLTIGPQIIPARPSLVGSSSTTVSSLYPGGPSGYVLDPPVDDAQSPPGRPASLGVAGYCFERGLANIAVTYLAGYQITNELATPVTSLPPQLPFGRWGSDGGVVYADGSGALTPVTASPLVGQYIPPTFTPTNNPPTQRYQFNVGEVKQVKLTYGYIPYDLDLATMRWIGEMYLYKGRIGERSTARPQGGGTASWDISDIPAHLKLILNPYKSVAPIA